MKHIKNFGNFINESWYATFKAQGEVINKKDSVTVEELEKIAYYLKEYYDIVDIQIGEIYISGIEEVYNVKSYTKSDTVKQYGITGVKDRSKNRYIYPTVYSYYWKDNDEGECGWVGKVQAEKLLEQFMSPFQFLECIEMEYFYLNKWIKPVSEAHLAEMEREMEKLSLKSPRRGKISGIKYGI